MPASAGPIGGVRHYAFGLSVSLCVRARLGGAFPTGLLLV